MKINTPQVRFRGFSGEWEERKLEDVADFFNERRIPIDSEKRLRGEYPYYGATGIIDYVEGYIFEGEYVLLAEDGANIITRNSPIAYLTQKKFWVNNHAHIMKVKSGSNLFLMHLLEKQNYIKYNTGTTQPKLNSQVVKNIILRIPGDREQLAVGEVLNLLDKNIFLHQQELTTLKQTKQGLLQKMFPKEGESVPEVRFPGFSGDWEQRKLGDLLEERNEQMPEHEKFQLMSFTATEGVTPKSDRYNREFLVTSENKKYKKTEKGDLIYSSNNLDVGSIGLNNMGNAVISPVYSIFYVKDGITSEFMGMLIQRKAFINKMLRYRQGVVYGQWRIHESDFLNIETLIPSHEEQIKFGNFFKQLDETISLHQRELDALKETKKAFLQKMFV